MNDYLKSKFAFSFIDINGKKTVFPLDSFIQHQDKHPELRRPVIKKLIQNAKNHPTVVYMSRDSKCKCYYLLEQKSVSVSIYLKVVVREEKDINIIKTAFFTDKIQEIKYNIKPIL